jgi:D-alanine transaminase/branched-chain amino acid aminotransferase
MPENNTFDFDRRAVVSISFLHRYDFLERETWLTLNLPVTADNMSTNNTMYAYVHPEIVDVSKATLHVSDLAIQRGYGIFDFFKVNDGHVFFLQHYLDRFFASAATMRLDVPLDRGQLTKIIFELVERNNLPESGIKIILTGGYSADGFVPGKPNLLMVHNPLVIPPTEQLLKGISVITYDYVRDVPGVKTINYTTGIWLLEKLRQENAADVLYYHNDLISEFPRSNFFIVTQDGTLVTAADNVLKGVTRNNILTLAKARGKVVEGNITHDDVYNAKEAFLSSTTKRIVPVVRVNNRIIGNGKAGEISQVLLADLIALEEADRKRFRDKK